MPTEILSIDKMLLQRLAQDSTLQGLLGYHGLNNGANNPRFPAGSTDATAAIFSDVAPQGTPEPFIVFTMENNVDVNAVGGFRAFEPAMYSVVAQASGVGYGGLKAFNDAIDACVQNYGPVLDAANSVWVYKFVRQSTIRMTQILNNVTWFYLGGVYESMTSQ